MKNFKKSVGLFAVAFALCMVFALGAKVNAMDVKMKEEISNIDNMTVPMVTDISNASFVTGSSSSFVKNKNTLRVTGVAPTDADYVEVGVYNNKDQLVTSKEEYCFSNGSFYAYIDGMKKNTLYYVRVRTIQKVNNQNTYGNWSEKRAIIFLKNKAKERENYTAGYETLTVNTQKIKGVKKYKVQVSKKRDSGYKNVKTIKAGKSITVSHYKGKRMKVGKTWYIRVIPILNSKISVDTWAVYYI